ncbi:hypothetical protein MHYP_G00083190 [Metynnis hypsauchen]
MVDFESYNSRTTTQPVATTISTVEILSSTFVTQTSGNKNLSPHVNQTQMENFLLRSWSGVPLWYDIIRWTLFTVMMVTTEGGAKELQASVGVPVSETKTERKTVRRSSTNVG